MTIKDLKQEIRVLFLPEVYDKIMLYTTNSEKSVFWFGEVFKDENDFIISDAFLPQQSTTYASSKIDEKYLKNMKNNKDFESILCLGKTKGLYSSFSDSQDLEYADKVFKNSKYYIYIETNAKCKIDISFVDNVRKIKYCDMPLVIDTTGHNSIESIKKELKDSVKSSTYSYTSVNSSIKSYTNNTISSTTQKPFVASELNKNKTSLDKLV